MSLNIQENMTMVMRGGAISRLGKRKAMFVFYGYAALTRRCQPAMAYSVVFGPLYSGDLRSFSSGNVTAASKPNTVDKAGAIHDKTGATIKVDACRVDPRSNEVAAEYRLNSREGEAENAEKRQVQRHASDAELAIREKGAWKRFVKTFMDFTNGAKLLWAEYKLAGKAKARLEQGHTLSWQERRIVRRVSEALVFALTLTLPLAVLGF